MKYQIQKYNKNNHADREVIVESQETMSTDQCNEWYKQVVANLDLPASHDTALVVEGHEWFKPLTVEVAQPVEQSEDSESEVEAEVIPLKPMERPPVAFADIAKYELAKSAEQRKEAYDAEVRLQKHIAELSL